eukprot:scaffold491842_cov19-Prasinocladus_malaysianus.AAC.1
MERGCHEYKAVILEMKVSRGLDREQENLALSIGEADGPTRPWPCASNNNTFGSSRHGERRALGRELGRS